MKRTAFVLLVVSCLVFGLVGTARAWWESNDVGWSVTGPGGGVLPGSCNGCHGASTSVPWGPHGGFSSSTDSCKACHKVHEASSINKLLPATTELGVCNACHDFSFSGTGGRGVYGAIRARSSTTNVAQSRHSIVGYNNTATTFVDNTKSYAATAVIPGAPAGTLLPTNSVGDRRLTCSHCHSPHGATTMAPWLGERDRSATSAVGPYVSNRILKENLRGTPKGSYLVYDSNWCAACHLNRHDTSKTPSLVNNHPVATSANATYGARSQAEGNNTWGTLVAPGSTITTTHLAGWSREATKGWDPMCQQCHEDYRNVEQAISLTGVDGTAPADNPRWQTFPHENTSRFFLVESGDDLCLNCHPTVGLP